MESQNKTSPSEVVEDTFFYELDPPVRSLELMGHDPQK